MQYTMKSGVLYEDASKEMLVKMKSSVFGPVKKIYCNSEAIKMSTDIRYPVGQGDNNGDVRNKEYIMVTNDEHLIAVGKPGYAPGDDPEMVGWPVCRLPRVDHADLTIENKPFLLTMHNSQNYSLRNEKNIEVMSIIHKGITGGWNINDDFGFPSEIICGIFAFCRYIEQENEFLMV